MVEIGQTIFCPVCDAETLNHIDAYDDDIEDGPDTSESLGVEAPGVARRSGT